MSRIYYRCQALVKLRQMYFFWFSNDRDGIEVVGSRVRAFSSDSALAEHGRTLGHNISSEAPASFDLDRAGEWLADPNRDTLDAQLLLDIWNLIEDYLRSIRENEVDHSLGNVDLYNKLFWANNLPAVTPPRERFDPNWTIEEVAELAGVLTEPYKLLREAFDTEMPNAVLPQSPPAMD